MFLVHDTFSDCALEVHEYQPNNFNSVLLTEQTKIAFSCYKGNNLKNKQCKNYVFVHDTSSECALQMYGVSLKYL